MTDKPRLTSKIYLWWNDNRRFKIQTIILFAMFLITHILFLWAPVFAADEEDVTLGGKAIARGYLLYRDFTSQHMPVTYYISALFDFLGAHSIYQQRIAFYIFYSLMWTFIFVRYRKDFDAKALALFPFLFMCVTCSYDMGTQILSEHVAGIGFVLIFMEYLRFKSFKDMTLSSCIILSVSILLTFGTIFVAAYALAVIVIAVFIKEIMSIVKDLRTSGRPEMKKRLAGFAKLAGIIILPWAIYLVYLLATGTLYEFYFSAYEMNRTIYPKYMGGGLGTSALMTLGSSFISGFMWFTEYCNILTGTDAVTVTHVITIVLFLGGLVHIFKKYGAYDMVMTFGFVIYLAGVRGMFNFHGTHCVEVMCLLGAIFFIEVVCKNCRNVREAGAITLLITAICAVWMLKPMSAMVGYLGGLFSPEPHNSTDILLNELTDKDEAIWNCSCENDLFMRADRTAMYSIAFTPWGYEAHEERIMDMFKENGAPRICVLDTGYNTWEYEVDDYAADMIDYIHENYTLIPAEGSCGRIYVRNDMVDTIPEKYMEK